MGIPLYGALGNRVHRDARRVPTPGRHALWYFGSIASAAAVPLALLLRPGGRLGLFGGGGIGFSLSPRRGPDPWRQRLGSPAVESPVRHSMARARVDAALLEEGRVLTHKFVIGELACGRLDRRADLLTLLRVLPAAPSADHGDVLVLIEEHRLAGSWIGWVDAHLLASALLAGTWLLTRDRALRITASRLGLAY